MSRFRPLVALLGAPSFRSMCFAMIALALGRLLDFAHRLVLARVFDTAAFGTVSVGVAMVTLMGTVSFVGGRVEISRRIASVHPAPAREMEIARAGAVVAMTGAFLMVIGVSIWAHFGVANDVKRLMAVMVFAVLPTVIFQSILAVFTGARRQGYVLGLSGLDRATVLILVAGFALSGRGIYTIGWAYVWGATATLLASLFILRHLWGDAGPVPIQAKVLWRDVLGTVSGGLEVWLSQLLSLARRYVDLFLVAALLPASDVGLYSGCLLIVGLMFVPLFGAEAAYLPIARRLITRGEAAKLKRSFQMLSRWLFLFGGCAAIVLGVFPETVLTVVVGDAYGTAAPTLQVLLLGGLVNLATSTQGSLNYAFNHDRLVLLGTALGFACSVVGGLVLMPLLGILGAAIASAGALAISEGLMVFMLYRRTGIHPIGHAHGVLLVGVVATIAAGRSIASSLSFEDASRLVLSIVLVAIFLITSLACLSGYRDDVKRAMRGALA